MADQNCVLQQLNTYQSNIQTLFQGVLKERDDYKEGNDFLAETMKQVYDKVENLERQNELLRTFNSSMKCIFSVGIVAFKKVDFSQVSCTEDNLTYLELLRKIFIDLSIKITDPSLHALSESNPDGPKKTALAEIECDDLDNKSKINVDFDDADGVTQLIENLNVDDNFMKEVKTQVEHNSIEWASWAISKFLNSTSTLTQDDMKKRLLDKVDTANSGGANAMSSASVSQSAESAFGSSRFQDTVVKDVQKQDDAPSQEKESRQNDSRENVAKKFAHMLTLNPRKTLSADQGSSRKSPVTPTRAKMLTNFSNQKRSASGFKGPAGKKLKQSVLNLKFSKEKGPENGDGGNINKPTEIIKHEVQVIFDSDSDSDDFIVESPLKLKQTLEGSRVESVDHHVDETFINSSVIRKFNMKHNHVVERIFKTSTQRKRAKENILRSPEYDSVPFVYKRETVRKKRERMKLPGHSCAECNKYYEIALGDVDGSDLKKILNKCSRHRDKNPPALDDTPPGYWKPYLTCSTVCSPKKDDAR